MKQNYTFRTVCTLVFLFVALSACGGADRDSTSTQSIDEPQDSVHASDAGVTEGDQGNQTNDPADGSFNDSGEPDQSSNDSNHTKYDGPSHSKGKYEDGTDQDVKTNRDFTTTDSDNVHISTGDSAIDYLKLELDMGNNDDIVFDDMGGDLNTDEAGAYYTIQLISKSLRENGGTGTVGLYKVYQDGTYELKNE